MNKKKFFLIRLLISLVIIGIILYKINVTNVLSTLAKTNILVLLSALLLYIIVICIGAYNIHLLLSRLTKRIKYKKIIKYTFISWSLGLFMPGKSGEFTLGFFLAKYKTSIGKTTAVVMADVIITVLTLAAIAIFGSFQIINLEYKTVIRFLVIMLLAGMILFYLTFINKLGRNTIKKYILKKYSKIFKGFYKSLRLIIKDKKTIILNFLLTISKFVISSAITFLLFLNFGEAIPLHIILVITSLTVLISTAPFTIHGLGLREASAAYFYSLIGIKAEITIAVYIVHLVIQHLLSTIILITFSKDLMYIKKAIRM